MTICIPGAPTGLFCTILGILAQTGHNRRRVGGTLLLALDVAGLRRRQPCNEHTCTRWLKRAGKVGSVPMNACIPKNPSRPRMRFFRKFSPAATPRDPGGGGERPGGRCRHDRQYALARGLYTVFGNGFITPYIAPRAPLSASPPLASLP